MKNILYNKNEFWIHIVLSIICILILLSIYYYLDELKYCDCFIENQDKTHKISVEFLKLYQLLEIFTLVVFIILITMYKNKYFRGGNKKNMQFGIQFLIILVSLILIFISGYVSYNTILLFLLNKKNCNCVNKWQKYIVYIQGIFNSIYFLRLVYLLLFIIIMIIFNFRK